MKDQTNGRLEEIIIFADGNGLLNNLTVVMARLIRQVQGGNSVPC